MTVSEPEALSANMRSERTEPNFGTSSCIIDLGRVIASRRQVLSVRRKSNTSNSTKHGKHIVNLVTPVIEATERTTPPTLIHGLECEPS